MKGARQLISECAYMSTPPVISHREQLPAMRMAIELSQLFVSTATKKWANQQYACS